MKGLAFNLSNAKKVATDDKSSTFTLKNGHQLRIVHSALPALQRKQLEKIPLHLAEGTADVNDDQNEPETDNETGAPQDNSAPTENNTTAPMQGTAVGVQPILPDNASPTTQA